MRWLGGHRKAHVLGYLGREFADQSEEGAVRGWRGVEEQALAWGHWLRRSRTEREVDLVVFDI
jgi:hypothetical protein